MRDMTDLLIRNVDVLRCEDDQTELLRNHDIGIRGNRVESVIPTQGAEEVRTEEIIDGSGLLAVPGLINTHAHVPMGIFRGLAEDVDITTLVEDPALPAVRGMVTFGNTIKRSD